MHKSLLFILLLTLLLNIPEALAQCAPGEKVFRVGEEVEYLAYYNWKFIWLNAAKVDFAVKEKIHRGSNVYHFVSTGTSHKAYDLFFKVRDRFESYVEKETFRPLWFERDTYEGGYAANDVYSFDYARNRAILKTVNSKRAPQTDTIPLTGCSFDVLSAIYWCRNIDFTPYKPGDKIPISMIIDNEKFELFVRYLGRETIETREKEKYDCIKFSVMLVEGTIFKGGEDLFVWVTNDRNRLPIMVEAKILIGSVKAIFQSAKNLKYPMTAKVE